MSKFSSQLAVAGGSLVAFQHENPILECRCVSGSCKKRQGCSKVKTDRAEWVRKVYDLFNTLAPSASVPSVYFENRASILRDSYTCIVKHWKWDDEADWSDFADNLFLTTKKAKLRKPAIRSTEKQRTQILIEQALFGLKHLGRKRS